MKGMLRYFFFKLWLFLVSTLPKIVFILIDAYIIAEFYKKKNRKIIH